MSKKIQFLIGLVLSYYFNDDSIKLLFGRFNSCMEIKILFILNEASRNDTHTINEKIKNAITRKTNKIKKKLMGEKRMQLLKKLTKLKRRVRLLMKIEIILVMCFYQIITILLKSRQMIVVLLVLNAILNMLIIKYILLIYIKK